LSLTPVERISETVVRNVPTSRFKESEGEFGHLHLDDKTGGHSFVSEVSSFEVRSSGTRRSGILHISTLERRASEMLSESAGKGFGIDDASCDTTKRSSGNVTSELLTGAGEPVSIQSLTETESVDNFVHNADHLSFVVKDVSTGSEVSGTDGNLTNDGSTSARSLGAGLSTGNVIAGGIGFYHEEPISSNTRLKNGRSGSTALAA